MYNLKLLINIYYYYYLLSKESFGTTMRKILTLIFINNSIGRNVINIIVLLII